MTDAQKALLSRLYDLVSGDPLTGWNASPRARTIAGTADPVELRAARKDLARLAVDREPGPFVRILTAGSGHESQYALTQAGAWAAEKIRADAEPKGPARVAAFAPLTADEEIAVRRIIDRVVPLFDEAGVEVTPLTVRMDLTCVHARTPLRFAEMADADDFNLSHDVFGIWRHLNRQTGDLGGFFLPRFAKPQPADVDVEEDVEAVDA